MLKLGIDPGRRPLRVVCIGAHSDDLEIGCAGTVLEWLRSGRVLDLTWVVLSAQRERAAEARRSARALLRGAPSVNLVLGEFTDGHFPVEYRELKAFFESFKSAAAADVVLTHRLDDRHQDHRLAAEVTWQTFRDQIVLEYEIPKYEGDLAPPNAYVPLAAGVAQRKVRHLLKHFATQRSKGWFRAETFFGLMQLRGIEARAPSGYAEAFHARKLVF
jgi:LmbE family N-acetylglucosaminyl deacetylase